MKKDEGGYIVVETILCFVLFMLLMFSILSLVNIVTAQARIHYALTQTAETLSMYSYVLDVTGADEHIKNSAKRAEEMRGKGDALKGNMNTVINGLNTLFQDNDTSGLTAAEVKSWVDKETGAVQQVVEGGSGAVTEVKGWISDTAESPHQALQNVLNYALNTGGSVAVSELLMEPMVKHYLSNGLMDGESYLKLAGVKEMHFYNINPLAMRQNADGTLEFVTGAQNSTLMDSEGNIWITVNYVMDYSFGALPLPFAPELKISQTVKTKAWLGGYSG